MILVKETK